MPIHRVTLCYYDSKRRNPFGFVVRLSLRVRLLRTARPQSKRRFRLAKPPGNPAVGGPGILFQCAKGSSGALALSQHVGLPLAVSVREVHSVPECTPSMVSMDGSSAADSSTVSVKSPAGKLGTKVSLAKLTTGSFENVVIDRPGSQVHKLTQDPDFIRAYVAGVLLVRLRERSALHPDVKRCFSAFNGGWSILRMIPSLRVARFIAGLAITSPANVISIWGRSLRDLASNTPNQLYWLRSSWSMPWPCQDTPLGSNNSATSLVSWLEETSKSRIILDTTIRTSFQAKLGISLICGNGSLPEIRRSNCSLACYGSHPHLGGQTAD
jgi:hypothetical protein